LNSASELVGHTRVQTTVDVYTRVRGGRNERVEKLREALALAVGSMLL
jgi:hypothetical protein